MQSVRDLQVRNRIFGTFPTIDELLDSAEERDKGEFSAIESGDSSIADKVRHEISVANGEVIEVDSDDDSDSDDDKADPSIIHKDILDLCQQLEVPGCRVLLRISLSTSMRWVYLCQLEIRQAQGRCRRSCHHHIARHDLMVIT